MARRCSRTRCRGAAAAPPARGPRGQRGARGQRAGTGSSAPARTHTAARGPHLNSGTPRSAGPAACGDRTEVAALSRPRVAHAPRSEAPAPMPEAVRLRKRRSVLYGSPGGAAAQRGAGVAAPAPLLALAVALRALNCVLVRTSFVPDEYWQSLEVAHHMVFKYPSRAAASALPASFPAGRRGRGPRGAGSGGELGDRFPGSGTGFRGSEVLA
ncbi:collagen, type I, alpha 1a-like [Pseudopipra pipra]|uniref:collagen, type I, alpha 1a-like n=1 Tax=Pseudopipra pipra TaxID=415032 RepID=UPI003139783B